MALEWFNHLIPVSFCFDCLFDVIDVLNHLWPHSGPFGFGVDGVKPNFGCQHALFVLSGESTNGMKSERWGVEEHRLSGDVN